MAERSICDGAYCTGEAKSVQQIHTTIVSSPVAVNPWLLYLVLQI